jgi:hypothetical protein
MAKNFPRTEKKGSPQNCREGQTLPLRQVPQAKSETCEDACPVVLPQLPQRERCAGPMKILFLHDGQDDEARHRDP